MDKLAKKILKQLKKKKKGTDYICVFDECWENYGDCTIEKFATEVDSSTEDVRAAVRFLVNKGYLEYQIANGTQAGFHLSHMGQYSSYFQRKKAIEYIADKWIDFFAMLLSIIALVLSIISMIKR